MSKLGAALGAAAGGTDGPCCFGGGAEDVGVGDGEELDALAEVDVLEVVEVVVVDEAGVVAVVLLLVDFEDELVVLVSEVVLAGGADFSSKSFMILLNSTCSSGFNPSSMPHCAFKAARNLWKSSIIASASGGPSSF